LFFTLLSLVHLPLLSDLLSFLNAFFLCFCLNRLRNGQPTIFGAWGELDDALRKQGNFILRPAGAVIFVLLGFLCLFLFKFEFRFFAVFIVHHVQGDPFDPSFNA
jgi:hypothetical protein